MRVRTLELRLIAIALSACWTLTAGIVLLGYRPGGPVDIAVGVAAALPVAIALAGLAWPPATHGERAFAGMVWLGLGSLLLLVPSIADVSAQLVQRGAQTLLPSVEAAYPWALALLGTSLFAGFGIARRLLGETAMRRRRLVRGVLVASLLAGAAASVFTAFAMANELALRDRPTPSSRFGPTDTRATSRRRATGHCRSATTARIELHLTGDLDGRSIGSVDLAGDRAGSDFRWLAYAATSSELGLHGAVPGSATDAWVREPFGGWRRRLDRGSRGRRESTPQALDAALSARPACRRRASRRGRHRGRAGPPLPDRDRWPGLPAGLPAVNWLVGSADLSLWRGELDYWVFLDGQLGRVTGSVNGDAGARSATAPSRRRSGQPGRDRRGAGSCGSTRRPADRRLEARRRGRRDARSGKRDRLARLTRVVALLRAHPDGMTIKDIASRIDVSVRTVYRDLNAIEGEIGIPVWSDGGRWGLAADEFLPPLKLTLRTRPWRSSCRPG